MWDSNFDSPLKSINFIAPLDYLKFYDNFCRNSLQRPPHQQQFQSTRLIKNMENSGRNRPYTDRGMMMRARHYSGHSTSPDRDGSPERGSYAGRQPRAPPRSYIQHRSPSSSPTRPPRARSSPTREPAMVRRVNSRRGDIDRSPSVMTSNGALRERSRESTSRRSHYNSQGTKYLTAQWSEGVTKPFWSSEQIEVFMRFF